MLETSLNIFDLIVLCVVGLSALLSFFRGFIREVLSLGAWVGASIITLYAFPYVAEWIGPQIKSPMVASGLGAMLTFMSALIVISIINGVLLKYVKTGSDVGLLDNMLGLVFGAARGGLLVAIGYFIMSVVLNEKDYPEWVQKAYSKPYAEKAAAWVAKVAPSYMNDISPLKKDNDDSEGSSITDKPKVIRGMEYEKATGRAADNAWQSLDELKRRMKAE